MARKKAEAVVETVAEVKEEAKAPVRVFPKKDFVNSQRFAKQKDLVNALLEEGKKYSIKEVEDIIHNFLYGKK